MTTHDFGEQLRLSNEARLEPFWEAAYRAAFPDFKCMVDNARDNGAQRCGVDRLVILQTSATLRIDEKVRSRDYGDMLLEVVSNDRTGAPGWIDKDLTIDFLAYGVLPKQRVYLFPWQPLRSAWARYGDSWKQRAKQGTQGYRVVPAKNRGYTTWSIAVPVSEVRRAVAESLVVDVRYSTEDEADRGHAEMVARVAAVEGQ
jgi:hypothetical protein